MWHVTCSPLLLRTSLSFCSHCTLQSIVYAHFMLVAKESFQNARDLHTKYILRERYARVSADCQIINNIPSCLIRVDLTSEELA